MPQIEIWTVRELLKWTAGYFERAGIPSPRVDAEWLLAEAMRCRRFDLYTRMEEVPEEDALTRFREWVKRRATREPLQQIIGRAPFLSLELEVDADVLIPRPETELLVEHAVVEVRQSIRKNREFLERRDEDSEMVEEPSPGSPVRILDIGTGSGCIAIGVATCLSDVEIVATDISPSAVRLAKKNAEQSGVAEVIRFRTGDLYAALDDSDGRFDLILSNPPYIPETDRGDLQREVRDFEPDVALYGGVDGLDIIRKLVAGAPARLLPGGRFMMEIGLGQAASVRTIFENAGGWTDIRFLRDYSGIERIAFARRETS